MRQLLLMDPQLSGKHWLIESWHNYYLIGPICPMIMTKAKQYTFQNDTQIQCQLFSILKQQRVLKKVKGIHKFIKPKIIKPFNSTECCWYLEVYWGRTWNHANVHRPCVNTRT